MTPKFGHPSNSTLATIATFRNSVFFHSPGRKKNILKSRHEEKANIGHQSTFKRVENGHQSNSTACIHTYIYIYVVVSLSGPSLGFWGVIIWSKFDFFEHGLSTHYIIGVSAHFFWTKKKLCAKMWGVIIWSKFAFLKRAQLGPDADPYLDQIMTPQNAIFCVSLLLKMC